MFGQYMQYCIHIYKVWLTNNNTCITAQLKIEISSNLKILDI